MSQAESINPAEFMRDACGNLIDKKNVKDIDFARNDLVNELVTIAIDLSDKIATFKKRSVGDIGSFVELSLERYGVKLGGKKGNVTLDSFDGQFRIERQFADHITFDEGLMAAKELIDQCLRDWTKGENPNVRTLIDHAFRVDKKGKLNTAAILGLRSLKMEGERWALAMDAISESVKVIGKCMYVRFYRRDENGKYILIPLDIASL